MPMSHAERNRRWRQGLHVEPNMKAEAQAIAAEARRMEKVAGLDQTWREQAACRGKDPNLFFPEGQGGSTNVQVVAAKAVCAGCPVRKECLDYALVVSLKDGVWGGMSVEERKAEKRRRVRARRWAS